MINPNNLNPDQLAAFIVGLLDGDGYLGVYSWRKRNIGYIGYRMMLKQADRPRNYEMLTLLSENFGGRVVREVDKRTDSRFVIWVITDREVIINNLFPVLEKYPLLTSQRYMQMKFMQTCIKENWSYETYIIIKESKYDLRAECYTRLDPDKLPDYFSDWLCGFIEAEGCFSITNMHKPSGFGAFSISQKHDLFLIEAIRAFYNVPQVSIYHRKDDQYILKFASRSDVQRVIDHCSKILQGYKFSQLVQFIEQDRIHISSREKFKMNI